ncbi:NAD-dependent epimerase/dehydratase family protein [Protaetiibacter sp. SSC-01]|uniref:NAD-dependent epimerase/dehydratase family protein n=1 Tax=Protaetiibacter sp. SSC-01 TaxID=2759943 RepID=UPI001656FDA1|nr:NAD-dependent epimerase/dehydratase family protein [Protaetiibacter sp. SSC-01]QNO37050.1 NAD-dependent epimerase/dehydratase family protein [Protaetiibacter sp. SSC-01]
MTSALFGASGFVGSNLAAAGDFDEHYGSANSREAIGREFGLVVFAAARAEKWRINQDPESDLAHIRDLEELVAGVRADRFVLVSTVDVYGNPVGVDETTVIPTEGLHPYGLHRLQLESFVREHHPEALIVRLPGLFGPGLKKNVIYDLLHDNNVDRIHRAGSFQYYNVARLWHDLGTAHDAGLRLVNLSSPPLRTDEIARVAFGIDFDNEPEGVKPGSYDVRSVHADAFGGVDGYTFSREQTLADLVEFVAAERAR